MGYECIYMRSKFGGFCPPSADLSVTLIFYKVLSIWTLIWVIICTTCFVYYRLTYSFQFCVLLHFSKYWWNMHIICSIYVTVVICASELFKHLSTAIHIILYHYNNVYMIDCCISRNAEHIWVMHACRLGSTLIYPIAIASCKNMNCESWLI